MSYWVQRQSGKSKTTGLKRTQIPCMHKAEGCLPREGQAQIGVVSILHDEEEPFILPTGHRHQCAHCRRYGPPEMRTQIGLSKVENARGGSSGPGGGISLYVTCWPKGMGYS